MSNSRIEDNPSFKKLTEDIQNMQRLGTVLPVLKPLLRIFGVKTDQMQAALAQLGPLGQGARDLITLPDRFNDIFSSRGWIMYEMMNVDVARQAIARAEAGDLDGAEQILVDYYEEDTLRTHLIWMSNVKAFRPRRRFAEYALADYLAGRYYACVPVILAQLDGLVNDLSPKVNGNARRGFFAEGSNLEVWDSISGHSSGLAKLAQVLRTNRTKTREDQNTLPDRHGILHGNDLGYDNQLVAAKVWAALFAAREWALRVEQNRVTEQPAPPQRTWGEIFRQMAETAEDKKRIATWIPRQVRPGMDVPVSGEIDEYEAGSPELKLVEFLSYWKARNYGYMAERRSYRTGGLERGPSQAAKEMREHYSTKRLKSFELVEIEDRAPALTIIRTRLHVEENGEEGQQIQDFRLLCEDKKGQPAVRGKDDCTWTIVTYLI